MRRLSTLTAILVLTCAANAQHSYVYVRDGAAICAPRQLPSVGIRQDNGAAVLGLHGASDAVCAACGWYRVVPSLQRAGTNQVISTRSYTIGKNTVQEVLTYTDKPERPAPTLQARAAAIFNAPELTTMQTDERVTAVITAVAQAVTGAVDKAVSVTIPAKAATGNEGIGRK